MCLKLAVFYVFRAISAEDCGSGYWHRNVSYAFMERHVHNPGTSSNFKERMEVSHPDIRVGCAKIVDVVQGHLCPTTPAHDWHG